MAFWKMDGLEVIPWSPSSSIRRFSSPVSSIFRLMSSSQTLCPRAWRAASEEDVAEAMGVISRG